MCIEAHELPDEMTVYDINNTAFYEAPITKEAFIKCTLMGDYYIELVFTSSQFVDFEPGCYVVYKDKKFDIIDKQYPEQNTKEGGYKYTLRFEAQQHHMRRRKVFWLKGANNEAVFHNTTTLDEFGQLIADNMNALFGTERWFLGSIPIELETTSKVVSFNGDSCWNAISQIAETFDVEWWLEEIDGNNYIHFGKCEFGESQELQIGDAVTDIPIKRGDDANYGTRFYVFGSTRNLTSDYYSSTEGNVTNHVAEVRLRLPEGIDYIDAKEDLLQQEVVEQVVFFEDIYPKNTDVVTDIETVERLVEGKEDVEVENINDESTNLSSVILLDSSLLFSSGDTRVVTLPITAGHSFDLIELYYHEGETIDMSHPIGTCEIYRGSGQFQLYIELWDGENNIRYSTKVLDVTNDFDNEAPIYDIPPISFDFSDDVKPLNTPLRVALRAFFNGTLETYDQPEDFAEVSFYDETLFTIFQNATYSPLTFTAYQVVAEDAAFIPSDVIVGEELKIKFTSGNLIGQEFDVDLRDDDDVKIDPATWQESDGFNKKFEIVAQIEEVGEDLIIIPNENLKPAVGDTFILTSVNLPSDRVREAENELYEAGKSWAKKNSSDTNVYDCPTNPVYCANQDISFEVGQRVTLIDIRLNGGRRESRIQGFEKSLWREYIATYTVGDNSAYSRLAQIESNIKENAYVERTGVQSSGRLQIITSQESSEPSDSNVYSALASDARYVKKANSDAGSNADLTNYLNKNEGGTIHEPIDVMGDYAQIVVRSNYDDTDAIAEVVGAKASGEELGKLRWGAESTELTGQGNLTYNGAKVTTNGVSRSGDTMGGSLGIQAPDVQLTLTGDQNEAGDYRAAIVAESVGEHFGGILWKGDYTNIEGASGELCYNGDPLATKDYLHDEIQDYGYSSTQVDNLLDTLTQEFADQTYTKSEVDESLSTLSEELQGNTYTKAEVDDKIDNIVVDVDLSDVSITEEVEVAEDASIITTSDFSDTPIAEEIVSADEAETLTYGEAQRHLRVFELNGYICLASSHQIYDDEKIALARKLSQGWSGKQGWSVSQQFTSEGDGPTSEVYEPHLFTLAPWLTPNPKQPNGMYYYKLMIDGNILTPSSLLYYFISSLDGRLQIYWGKRAKKVAFGTDTSGAYKRAASLRFGVAVGKQIAPFKLVLQSVCFSEGTKIYLDDTTWAQCVQFRV